MTGADLLNRMKVFDNELDIESGGDDETRALLALDMAQDYFDAVAASMPKIGQSVGTVVTVASTETTAWPSNLLRVDALWYIDSGTGYPVWEILPIDHTGGHQPQTPFPFNLTLTPGTGAPRQYAYDSEYFYWLPRPDAAYTVRVYGLRSKTDITTRNITFGWPDAAAMPIASFACRLLEMGIDDPSDELQALAQEAFVPVLRMLRKRIRQQPIGRAYTQAHST